MVKDLIMALCYLSQRSLIMKGSLKETQLKLYQPELPDTIYSSFILSNISHLVLILLRHSLLCKQTPFSFLVNFTLFWNCGQYQKHSLFKTETVMYKTEDFPPLYLPPFKKKKIHLCTTEFNRRCQRLTGPT